jgi:hypothetical protein
MDMSWDSNHSTTLRGMLMAIAASGSCSHIRGTDNAPQLTTTRGCHLLPPTCQSLNGYLMCNNNSFISKVHHPYGYDGSLFSFSEVIEFWMIFPPKKTFIVLSCVSHPLVPIHHNGGSLFKPIFFF